MNAADQLKNAREARLAGDYKRAELLARQILDKNPVHAEAAGFLGQCLAELGDPKAARKHVEMALGLAPSNASVRLNSAAVKDREGDLPGAIAEALEASNLEQQKFEIWATLGNYLGKAGLFDKAAAALKNACMLNPNHPGAGLLLAGACLEVGDREGALEALDLVDKAAPDLPQSLKIRTRIARSSHDVPMIALLAERWLRIDPADPEARMASAFASAAQGYFDKASAMYAPLAERNPPDAEHLAAMGRYRLGARDVTGALDWFARAIAADPACAEAHFGRARALTFLGALGEAEEACRSALRCEPEHVDALAQLTEIRSGDVGDRELAALKAVSSKALASDKRATALFAIGDALHARKARAEAFDAWTKANAIKAGESPTSGQGAYNRQKQEELTERLKSLFPRSSKESSRELGAPTPIFIVGMPRSGTTLLESALSAHPRVEGGGELPGIPQIVQEFLEAASSGEIPQARWESWRGAYLDNAASFGLKSAPFFTDKQPSNFLAIGLIGKLFPTARIVHIRRNPIETGFSVFRRNFSRQWPYAHDLENIAHYYGQYADIMRHWDQNYPDAFISVQYETLVDDFEAEIRRILEWCGLDWSPACLDHHTAERAVITFSAVQVRQPASRRHLGSAAPYERELEPLRNALFAAGVDLQTGAKAARVGETVH